MVRNGLNAQQRRSGGYVVRAPRPTDAIQGALKSAYGRDERLPGDISHLLDRLDRIV